MLGNKNWKCRADISVEARQELWRRPQLTLPITESLALLLEEAQTAAAQKTIEQANAIYIGCDWIAAVIRWYDHWHKK